VITAVNGAVAEIFDLKVIVTIHQANPGVYKVLGIDSNQYGGFASTSHNGAGATSYLPHHGGTHSFGIGLDPVFIFKRQMLQPLGAQPTDPLSNHVYVQPDYYIWKRQVKYFSGANSADLTVGNPLAGSSLRYITIYLNGDTNSLGYITGTTVGTTFGGGFFPTSTGTVQITIPDQNVGIPLLAVLLQSGTALIDWPQCKDIRVFLSSGEIDGAGTVPYIAQWVSGSVLGNSPLIVDTAMRIKPAGAVNGNSLVFDGNYWVPGAGSGGGSGGGTSNPVEFSQLEYAGGNINLGTSNDGSFVDVDATNAAISVTPSNTGTYEVTFSFYRQAIFSNDSDYKGYTLFRLSDGTNNFATTKVGYLTQQTVSGADQYQPVTLTALFTWNDTSLHTVKLQKQNVNTSSVLSSHYIVGGSEATLYRRVFRLGGTDHKVAVSSTDTTADYLQNKLVAGTNITITRNTGTSETLTIASSANGTVLGSGTAGRLAEWVDISHIRATTIIKSGAGIITFSAPTDNTLTLDGSIEFNVTGAVTNNPMIYNGTKWIPSKVALVAANAVTLTVDSSIEIDGAGATNGQALLYNNTLGKYAPGDVASGGGSGHDHGVTRISAISGTINIPLLDFAYVIEMASFNGFIIDPVTYSISSGSDYLVLDSALNTNGPFTVTYQILSI